MSRKMILVPALAVVLAVTAGCASGPLSQTPLSQTSLGAALGVGASGGAAFELGSAAAIAPAPRPSARDWSRFTVAHFDRPGRDVVEVAASGRGLRGRFWDGCEWTRAADWFAPSDSWANCGTSTNWRSATATVSQRGDLWPLRVGATAEYVREARSLTNGAVSERTTRCRVTGAVRTRLSSGAIEPAYTVRCADGRRVRTSWWSPERGLLFYRQEHVSRGVEQFWERLL